MTIIIVIVSLASGAAGGLSLLAFTNKRLDAAIYSLLVAVVLQVIIHSIIFKNRKPRGDCNDQ